MKNNFWYENRQLLILALPLILNYFVEGCPNFINNVMIAHLGVTQLAAGAIVNSAFTSVLLFFYGMLAASSTLIAHHYGANEHKQIGEIIRDSTVIAIITCIPFFVLLWYGPQLLALAGQPPSLILLATPYLHGLMFALIPDFGTMILWQFFIGLGRPKVTLVSSLAYVPINILANYVLMFGHLGFPALGMFGIGLGTAFGFWILLIGFILYILWKPEYRCYFTRDLLTLKHSHIKALLIVGIPLGAMWTIDRSFTMVASFFAGKISPLLLAAQQIGVQAITLASIATAGLSQAISVRIGHTWGAKNYAAAKLIALSGLLLSLGLGLIMSLIFWFKPLWLIGVDFNVADPANHLLITTALSLFVAFGFYQIADSLRYSLFAALRGLKDTSFSAWCSFLGYYGIGLGLGYPLLFYWGGNLTKFWYLISFALLLIVLAMVWRFKHLLSLQKRINIP